MKKELIFGVLFGALLLSGCGSMTQTSDIAKNNPAKMQQMENSNYKIYSDQILKDDLGTGKKVILFFAASRCPSCKNLDEEIMNNLKNIPNDIVILKVDYDNSKDLKIKYLVTSQHTLVYIDKDQNLVKKMTGGSFSDLIGLVK